jgi:anthranilate synthase component 2
MTTLILDNYDSFTFNLYQYVGELDGKPVVVRNDALRLDELVKMRPDRIIISPGPGHPDRPSCFGVCRSVIEHMGCRTPLLGVCLGHQGIFSCFGGRVVRAVQVMHGKTSAVWHDDSELFSGLPQPFEAMRYHSLVADPSSVPPCLEVTARTQDGVIMGIRHRTYPIYGIQFHPESIGTPEGRQVIENFVLLRSP